MFLTGTTYTWYVLLGDKHESQTLRHENTDQRDRTPAGPRKNRTDKATVSIAWRDATGRWVVNGKKAIWAQHRYDYPSAISQSFSHPGVGIPIDTYNASSRIVSRLQTTYRDTFCVGCRSRWRYPVTYATNVKLTMKVAITTTDQGQVEYAT